MRDIISNSLGAWIGTLIAATLRAMVHARDAKVLARAKWEEERARRTQRASRDPNRTAVLEELGVPVDRTPTAPTRQLPF